MAITNCLNLVQPVRLDTIRVPTRLESVDYLLESTLFKSKQNHTNTLANLQLLESRLFGGLKGDQVTFPSENHSTRGNTIRVLGGRL